MQKRLLVLAAGILQVPVIKKAKDMGSAAQFTAQLFLAAVWGGYLLGRL